MVIDKHEYVRQLAPELKTRSMYFENNSAQVDAAMTNIWTSFGEKMANINKQLHTKVDSIESRATNSKKLRNRKK